MIKKLSCIAASFLLLTACGTNSNSTDTSNEPQNSVVESEADSIKELDTEDSSEGSNEGTNNESEESDDSYELNITWDPDAEDPSATWVDESVPVSIDDERVVPDVPNNTTIELNKIKINGVAVYLNTDSNLKELLEITNIKNDFGSSTVDMSYEYFNGLMYKAPDNESTVSIEVYKDGFISIPESDTENYTIKALGTSEFFTKENPIVYFAEDIYSGMPIEDFYSIYGEGEELESTFDKRIGYANDNYVLVISEDDGIVDDITLFIK